MVVDYKKILWHEELNNKEIIAVVIFMVNLQLYSNCIILKYNFTVTKIRLFFISQARTN